MGLQIPAPSQVPAMSRQGSPAGMKRIGPHDGGSGWLQSSARYSQVRSPPLHVDSQLPSRSQSPSPSGHAGHITSLQLPAPSHEPRPHAPHGVSVGAVRSVGQRALDPVQDSAMSHVGSIASRHTVVLGSKASGGHAALSSRHVSARSQTSAAARQTVPPAKVSAGQLAAPAQVSTTSHTPAEARHTVPVAMNLSLGQLVEAPLQRSSRSHVPATGRHTVVEGA